MFDSVKCALILGLVALFLGVFILTYFAYINTWSRNVSFAVATVGASAAMLVLNLLFDLRGSTNETTIPTQYTIDTHLPRIRQWVYPPNVDNRYMTETTASAEAVSAHPEMLAQNSEKLVHDMIYIFDLVILYL